MRQASKKGKVISKGAAATNIVSYFGRSIPKKDRIHLPKDNLITEV